MNTLIVFPSIRLSLRGGKFKREKNNNSESSVLLKKKFNKVLYINFT